MSNSQIGWLATVFMAVSALISLGVPIILLVWIRRRHRAGIVPALVGAAVFYIFVFVLEINAAIRIAATPVGAFFQHNVALFSLYGGLMAGIFEETGRLLAFTILCHRYRGVQNSVSYGIGHGGIESILLSGLPMATLTAFSIFARVGGMDRAMSLFGVDDASLAALLAMPPSTLLASGIERMLAIALHIALSVLVYLAVTRRGSFRLFWLAIALHAAVDFPAGLYQSGVISNIWLIECLVAAMCVGICLLTWHIWTLSNRGYSDLLPYDPR